MITRLQPGNRAVASERQRLPQRGSARAALIPALVTLAVTLYQIQRPSFSRDESATLLAVHRSFPDLLRMLRNDDAVHGAYYVLMWLVTRAAGSGEFAVRFPSAVAMAAAAAAVALTGRHLVSGRAGLAAGLAFAALPSVSWYAANARENASVTVLAAAAGYLLIRAEAASDRQRRRWLGGYAAVLAVLGLGNFFALLIIPAHAVTLAWLAGRERGESRGLVIGWLAAVAAAAAVVSPVVAAGYAQRDQIGWISPIGARELSSLTQLAGSPAVLAVMAGVVALGLAASAAGGRMRADWPAGLAALTLPWLVLPGMLLALASLIHPVFNPRYLVFCVPALALICGTAAAAVSRSLPSVPGWAAGAATLAVFAAAGLPVQAAERGPGGHGHDVRAADLVVTRDSRPGDALLNISYWPASRGGGVERQMEAAYPSGLARLRDISQGRAPAVSATLGGTFAAPAVIRRRLAAVTRVWVASWNRRQAQAVAAWDRSQAQQVAFWSRRPGLFLRRAGFTLAGAWRFRGAVLWLYSRPPAR